MLSTDKLITHHLCLIILAGTFGHLSAGSPEPGDSLVIQLNQPRKRYKVAYNGADFSLSAGYRFINDNYLHSEDPLLSERYDQANREVAGIAVSAQLELPLNRTFRAGTGINYGQHRRRFSPAAIGLSGPSSLNTQHLLQLPIYLAADHRFSRFSVGAAAGSQLAVFSRAQGRTLDPSGEVIDYTDEGSADKSFYNKQPSFSLLLGIRAGVHLAPNLNLIARIDYRGGNHNGLAHPNQSATLSTSTVDFRLGINYALVCFE